MLLARIADLDREISLSHQGRSGEAPHAQAGHAPNPAARSIARLRTVHILLHLLKVIIQGLPLLYKFT